MKRPRFRRAVIIANPVAGSGSEKRISEIAFTLADHAVDFELMITRKRGDAERYADKTARSQRNKHDSAVIVIAAGGDGTFNEVANGLAGSPVPLAVIPLGTVNVLAEEIHIPKRIHEAVGAALTGEIRSVHPGKLTFRKDGKQETRLFLLMAGIGFDGETVFSVNPEMKRITGRIAYLIAGLKTFLRYRPMPLQITGDITWTAPGRAPGYRTDAPRDGSDVSASGYTVIIGKSAYYGGRFMVTPDARIDEPVFSLFVSQAEGRTGLMRCIAEIVRNNHLKREDIRYGTATRLHIRGNAHIQIDGDYAGMTPADIEIAPGALNLVFGRGKKKSP